MIYSNDINKVCALCLHSEKTDNGEDELFCALKKMNVPAVSAGCKKFEYDIFKKVVHRKKRLKTEFSAEDFSLE